MATTYLIFENGDVIDTRDTKARVYSLIPFLTDSAIIAAFDPTEMTRDGSTPIRDVTEDITRDWWHYEGDTVAWETIASGKSAPALARRYFPDECAAYEAKVEAA